MITQDSPNLAGAREDFDEFGGALAIADFGGGPR
jgi:hypothetical protein